MIRFRCPSCQQVLQVDHNQAENKIPCPQCGQRLQVPGVKRQNKTVLGSPMTLESAGGLALVAPPAPKVAQWYYCTEGQKQGPVALTKLGRMYGAGRLQGTDLVWTEGMGEWQPVQAVAHRFEPTGEVREVQEERPAPRRRIKLFVALGGCLTTMLLGALVTYLLIPKPDPDGKKPEQAAAVQPQAEMTVKDVVKLRQQSVANIEGRFSGGSGFMVADHMVVTNYHVIDDETIENVRVSFPSGPESARTPRPVELVYIDPQRDLAILRVTADVPAVRVAGEEAYEVGETVVVIGSPGSTDGGRLVNGVSTGVLGGREVWKDQNWYNVDAPVNHGNSGGPVFNLKGEVIGAATRGGGDETQDQNFCVPGPEIRQAVDKARHASAEDVARAQRKHQAIFTYRGLRKAVGMEALAVRGTKQFMQEAVSQGQPASVGFRWRPVDAKGHDLRKLSDLWATETKAVYAQVTGDGQQSPTLKQGMEKLLKAYEAYRDYGRTVNGSLDDYTRETDRLAGEVVRQLNEMVRLTGAPTLYE